MHANPNYLAMITRSKTLRQLQQYEDRISSLPDDLLGLIINHLPVVEAVRTTALSKRWQNLWTKELHNLDFSGMEAYRTEQAVVPMLDLLQTPSITSCTVTYVDYSVGRRLLLWLVGLLGRRGVRCFTFKCGNSYARFRLDVSNDMNSVTDLHLKHWFVRRTNLLAGCVRLTTLSLDKCSVLTDSFLVSFLQTCKNLENLTLNQCERLMNIGSVSSEERILRLDMSVTSQLKHLKIKETFLLSLTINNPKLETLYLDTPQLISSRSSSPARIKLHANLRSLVLRAPIKLLHNIACAYDDLPQEAPVEDPPFVHLKRLEVEVNLQDYKDCIYFSSVLKKCFVLTELVVWVKGQFEGPEEYESFWDNQDFDCLKCSLRRVEVRGCKGSQLEEGFVVDLVGRKAKLLTTLVVSCESKFVEKWSQALNKHKGSSVLDDIRFTAV